MKSVIPVESISSDIPGNGVIRKELLSGEIPGARSFACLLAAGQRMILPDTGNEMIILCLLSGNGTVFASEKTFPVTERSVLIPAYRSAVEISAGTQPMTILEIRWLMTDADAEDLAKAVTHLPYFTTYSACKTYKEAIKSPKTVNRTLVPENTIPRFCMGSVETEGPDAVGAHKHPMLEQHFFGLPENDVWVKADAAEVRLAGNMLLHIPLGSEHSVRVETGKKLHYLWLDYFRDKKGVEWITKMHTVDG